MSPEADAPSSRFFELLCVGMVGVAALLATYAAASRGIWLDEFWSLHLGRDSVAFETLARMDWTRDTHPALANLLYRTTTALGFEDIIARRLALNAPPLIALAGAMALFTRRLADDEAAFPATLLLLTLALSATIGSFADYRSYGWQIAAVTTTVGYAFWLLHRNTEAAEALPHAVGLTGVFFAIGLHYVIGLTASVFVLALFVQLWVGQRRRDAVRLALAASAAWLLTLASAIALLRDMSRSIDHAWIKTSTFDAIVLLGYTALLVILANPVVAVLSLGGRNPATAFKSMLAAAIVAALALLLVVNAITPVVVERYLVGWQVLICGLVAAAASTSLRQRPLALAAALTVSMVGMGVHAHGVASQGGWNANLGAIVSEVEACPATRVFAVSAQRLTVIRSTSLSKRESAMIADAYRSLGRSRGIDVEILDLDGPAALPSPSDCPTLLWIEHLDWAYVGNVTQLLRIGRFTVSGGAYRATVRTSDSGFLVRFAKSSAPDEQGL